MSPNPFSATSTCTSCTASATPFRHIEPEGHRIHRRSYLFGAAENFSLTAGRFGNWLDTDQVINGSFTDSVSGKAVGAQVDYSYTIDDSSSLDAVAAEGIGMTPG